MLILRMLNHQRNHRKIPLHERAIAFSTSAIPDAVAHQEYRHQHQTGAFCGTEEVGPIVHLSHHSFIELRLWLLTRMKRLLPLLCLMALCWPPVQIHTNMEKGIGILGGYAGRSINLSLSF